MKVLGIDFFPVSLLVRDITVGFNLQNIIDFSPQTTDDSACNFLYNYRAGLLRNCLYPFKVSSCGNYISPLFGQMCLTGVQKKKSGGKYNKHFPAPIPSFLLPKRRFTTLQLQLPLSALGSQAIPGSGLGYGWACLWLCQLVA